jgi:hypothetical protein
MFDRLSYPVKGIVPINSEEFTIFVERLTHFNNLWTVYSDMLTRKYVPSVGDRDWSIFDPRTTMMLMLYAYFYSLIEDSSDGLNGFRVWREHFPEEEQAIVAVEAVINPFKDELRLFRNRLGFHGSRSREHESRGFELFAKSSGTETFEAVKRFKALGAILLYKDRAVRSSNAEQLNDARLKLDQITQRAKAQTERLTS